MIRTILKHSSSTNGHNAVLEFQAALHGQLLQPDDPGYDAARRIWNGAVDKRPAYIVRCKDTHDVVQAVLFARRSGLPLAVRAGGHNAAGLSLNDGGVVIDVSPMKQAVVNAARWTVRAGAGLTLGELSHAVEPYGLVSVTGTCSSTGVAGSSLGGGIGWLSGKYGLASDNLLAAEMVTASGEVVIASETENPDLYWALRGGGGNFGIVTTLEFRLFPQDKVLGGMVAWPLAQGREVLRFFREFSAAAPDELGVMCVIATFPGLGPVIMIHAAWAGDLSAGEQALAPLRRFGQPALDTIHSMSYSELLHMHDPTAPAGRHYADAVSTLTHVSDAAIEGLLDISATMSSPFSSIIIFHLHGAAVRVPVEETAFALRYPQYPITLSAGWEEGPEASHVAWAEASRARLQPYGEAANYINFYGVATDEEVRASYGRNYARLAEVKRQYDPENLFHSNQNISPAQAEQLGG